MTVAMILALGCQAGFAAGASASVSGGSAEVGETITVKVTFKCSDIGVAGGKLTYDASILEFKSGSGANGGGGSVNIAVYASGEGQSSLTASMKFSAIKAGTCKLSLSGASVIEFTSEASHSVSGSGSVTVSAAAPAKTKEPTKTKVPAKTKEPSKTKEPAKPTASPSATPTLAPIVEQIDGVSMTLISDFAAVTLPEGFEKSTTTYQNREVPCASAGDLKLLCFSDGSANHFYILSDTGLIRYRSISGTQKRYLFSDDAVAAPEGFSETKLTVGENTERAWISEDDEKSGFYLLYLSEPGKAPEFYQYDSEQGTLQRFINRTIIQEVEVPVEVIVEKTPEPTPIPQEPEGLFLSNHTLLYVIAGCVALAILLIVLLAVSISRGAKLRNLRSTQREELMTERSEKDLPPAADEEIPAEAPAEAAPAETPAEPAPAAEQPPAAAEPAQEAPAAPIKKTSAKRTKHKPAH